MFWGIPTSESLDIALVWKVGSAMGRKKRLWKCEEHGPGRSLRAGSEARGEVLVAAGCTGTDRLGSGAVELVRNRRNGEISFTGNIHGGILGRMLWLKRHR